MIVKKSKYGNQKTFVDGIKFDSKREAHHYTYLKILMRKGDIKDIVIQPTYELYAKIKYKADFLVKWADGTETVQDVKGFETPVFKLKKKMFEHKYGIKLEVIK